jgi:DNA-directed RNA polymerase subunit RPC12/RpoP
MAGLAVNHYPEGVTAGSPVFDTADTADRWCSTCGKETEHALTERGAINLYTCMTCSTESDEDMSEPDPDQAYDRAREGW